MYYVKEHNILVSQPFIIKWMLKTITTHCQAKFAANVEFTPKFLDAEETMVLFNLPRPWILLCGQEKQPTEIDLLHIKLLIGKIL